MKKTPSALPPELGALLDRAEEYVSNFEYVLAEQLANEVLTLANVDGTLQARALCILGACCSRTARYDDALAHYDNANAAAEAASNLGLQSRALRGASRVQNDRGDYRAALGTAEQALAVAIKVENKHQQARSLYSIALVHQDLADYPRALDHWVRALALDEEIGNKQGIAGALSCIGRVHMSLADYPKALEYFARGLVLAEEIGDKNAVETTLGAIGTVYVALADYTRAFDYYARALALDEEIADKQGVAAELGNIGLTCIESGDFSRALDYLKRALDLSEQIGARRLAGYWMKGIAEVECKLGNLTAAYQGFLNTLHLRRDELKTDEGITEILIKLGSVLLAQGKTEEGLARLMEALQLAEQLGEKNFAAEAHKEIAVAYVQTGDAAKELDHLKKHYAIEKEIFSEESKKRVELFNMRVAVAEIEHGVEVQKLRVERMEHEISSQAIHLAAQTELVDKFRNDLRQIVREIDEPIAALKKIKEKLKELPCQQIDWPKFEVQFNEVHPEFRAKLSAKFPELTHMEQRIAAMVRMDLTSSDIARLFCITERAVEFHRLNLRKKLKLKQEENLPKFLSQV